MAKTEPKPVNVAIGILAEKRPTTWRVLITRRPPQAVLGAFWELPGGKIEPGETAKQCLQREFDEEVGLTVAVGEALPAIEYGYDHGVVRLHPHYCTRRDGEVEHRGVADHRWVASWELADYSFPPANVALMLHIAKWLAQRED